MGREGRHGIGIPLAPCLCGDQVKGRFCKSPSISHATQSKEGNHSTYKVTAGTWSPETHAVSLEQPPAASKTAAFRLPVSTGPERGKQEGIHPTVPNPYILLSALPPDWQCYMVLNLKGAFFSLPLISSSQPYFAFEREDPEIRISDQLTWTRLP